MRMNRRSPRRKAEHDENEELSHTALTSESWPQGLVPISSNLLAKVLPVRDPTAKNAKKGWADLFASARWMPSRSGYVDTVFHYLAGSHAN